MPVSIPRIEKFQQQSDTLPKNDRINLKVQDSSSAILNQTGAIKNIGDKVGDIYQNYENDKIDQLSTEAEGEYQAWNKQKLAQIKAYEGDPTDAYVEYEKEATKKRQDILDKRPDLNERVKRHLTSRLDGTIKKANVESTYQRGMQQEVYSNNVFESGVKLKKDSLPVTAGYVQAGVPDSYAMFDDGMSEIKTMISKRGLAKGTVTRLPDDAEKYTHSYRDDDGKLVKVSMSDMAKQRVAKELSEGVRSSIDTMIASGNIETAKEMQEKYKGYLDPKAAVVIANKFKTAGRKDEAYNVIGTLRGKSDEAQIQAVEKITDPELKSEVLKIKDADDRRVQHMKDRKAKANYETLANNVLEKMNSDQPYFGVADLENDPVYKQTFDNMTAKQKKAVIEMVESPKDSSPSSELRVQNLFLGTDNKQLETITPAEFAEYTTGLSKADKTKYNGMFMSMRTQTEGEKRATYSQAGNMLRDQLIADKHISRNTFGKIAGKDEITLIKANQKLMEHLSSQYGTFKPEQLQKFVKDFSAAEIKGKVFNPEPRNITRPKSDSRSTASDVIVPTGDALIQMQREFRKVNKYFPTSSDAKFIEFVKRNQK